MGEDLDVREVQIGYQIEHAMSYQNSGDPKEIARQAIREFKPLCHDIAETCDPPAPDQGPGTTDGPRTMDGPSTKN